MNADLGQANAIVMRRLLLLAAAMFGFGFALVPLYSIFCDITGLNRDEAQVLARNTQVDRSRSVQVQMLSNSENGDRWRLLAPTGAIAPHPGELVEIEYELDNLSDRPLVGRAVPSYAPARAAAYFKKIECFCFREQRLAPHEKLRMPVLFVLDNRLPADIGVVTLSYTFYAKGES
ncbi:MAG: cytochrome c oxidase assembly protein [Gallionellaceae bacterium]|nr:cytochrome c oxidase assembly protein [Gallionellaceae bacterium]MDD5366832.1 cytochrome c oxidase assembly protein [Gallionellaceae bacterium]